MTQKPAKRKNGVTPGSTGIVKLVRGVAGGTSEERTIEQLREHYEVEKELADRLRQATRLERRHAYASSYDEMFRRVPDHPQLTRKSSEERVKAVSREIKRLESFLNREVTFLEVGAGDCALSFEVAKRVKKVYAVDVSEEITRRSEVVPNFQLVLSDGCSIPVPPNSIQLAYSNQVMEHLHPEDASEQLRNIYESLVPGGIYICITPNRLSGPHDISQYFDPAATGFHLKEYSLSELNQQFKSIGFTKVRIYLGMGKTLSTFPLLPFSLLEAVLNILPHKLRKLIARSFPTRTLLGIRLVGIK